MREQQTAAKTTAFCGMAAALSVAILMISGMIPVLTYTAPLAVSLILVPVKKTFGNRAAWMTFTAVSLLAVILGADKEAAFFYLFFGWYPLFREQMEKIPGRLLKAAAKMLLFSLLTAAMYSFLILILGMQELRDEHFWMDLLFYLLFVLVMMMFDTLLGRAGIFRRDRYRGKQQNRK